jgi:ribosomal protein S18 acetylase RimI-like enzyme
MTLISKGLSADDRIYIEDILRSTGFFYDFEVEIALGLVDDTIASGTEICGYHWMRLIDNNGLVAFANYVKNSFSVHSWDLYWIAVHNNSRHKNLGSTLLRAVEDDIRNHGGKILWLDTSGRPLYAPTENFYIRNGYTLMASLTDFYAPGDPKQIYSKVL